jgi:membrane protein DedA with SNARE-associated domain
MTLPSGRTAARYCSRIRAPARPPAPQSDRYARRSLLLTFASLTEPLVRFATHLIADLGYAGVFLLTTMTSIIGLPGTEPTMLFAGFDVYQGNLTLVGIIVAGVAGDMTGASIAYAIGYFGQRELLEHQGSKLHVSPRRLNRAHQWFERYGSPTIFISRMLPVVRAVFPYAAGVARMPFWRFFVLATLGSIIWIGGLAVLGQEVGSQWPTWRHHLEYVDYAAVAVLVLAIVYLIVRRRSSRNTPPPPSSPPAAPSGAPNRSAEPAADVVSD